MIPRQGPETPSKPFQTENPRGCRSRARSGLLRALVEPGHFLASAASAVGAVCGIAGAFLLAMPALPGWGFGAFTVSNIAWLVSSRMQRQTALHLQQWVFLVSSLLGLWNWWLAPLLGR